VQIVLLSTYDLGRQPFGLASPAAWLRIRGHQVTCVDLSVTALPTAKLREARLIAIYVPMHTATRMAGRIVPEIRRLNQTAHVCCYGLYAPLNDKYLRELGVDTTIGGEFEPQLAALAERLEGSAIREFQSLITLDRIAFVPPDRAGLPVLRGQRATPRPVADANIYVDTAQWCPSTRVCFELCQWTS
jgi:hypothetical protein